MNGYILISQETFFSEFLGGFPINLAGTTLRYRNGQFVRDDEEDFEV
ncbi:MAG: hypothetical protein JO235_28080 [Chroococcidiopsidaceae cyanobacterium CP_BM_RX_35]|nr:hypothetical protein [Chroococcidiopsidaceae cyanobacterium CP_BM_RX_35]